MSRPLNLFGKRDNLRPAEMMLAGSGTEPGKASHERGWPQDKTDAHVAGLVGDVEHPGNVINLGRIFDVKHRSQVGHDRSLSGASRADQPDSIKTPTLQIVPRISQRFLPVDVANDRGHAVGALLPPVALQFFGAVAWA